jgi:tetratricopeptide (TPR) repeat protein
VSDEWFRRPEWDDAAREEFERRLARARPFNRSQYLRIKALALLEAGEDEGARVLLLRVLDHPDGNAHDVGIATEHLGNLAVQHGDRELAELYYRRVLAEPRYPSGTTGGVEIALAELLLDKGGYGHTEALTLLHSWLGRPDLKFSNQMFRWHLAVIKAAEQAGDRETARRSADAALELASRGPQFPRHKDVGLVHADPVTLRRLRKLAR